MIPASWRRVTAVLSLLGGSLELSIALPETFRFPVQADAPLLAALSLIIIFCGAMTYTGAKLQTIWAAGVMAASLLTIVIGSPLEGFEGFGPSISLTGGILAFLDYLSMSDR